MRVTTHFLAYDFCEGLEAVGLEPTPAQVGNRAGAPCRPQPLGIIDRMKDKATREAIDKAGSFEGALKAVLRVSKDDMKAMLEAEKKAKIGKPKRGPKPRVVSSSRELYK